jgi:putative SOS response-associated peptidase YedK
MINARAEAVHEKPAYRKCFEPGRGERFECAVGENGVDATGVGPRWVVMRSMSVATHQAWSSGHHRCALIPPGN